MGSSETQNCQRGTIFMTFLVLVFFCVVHIMSLIKKRIDPLDEDADGEKYKESKEG